MIEINDFFVYLICFGFIVTWVLVSIAVNKVDKLLKPSEITDQQKKKKEMFLNKRGWRANSFGYFTKDAYLNCSLDFAYQIEIEKD